jgi:hypothetical protein
MSKEQSHQKTRTHSAEPTTHTRKPLAGDTVRDKRVAMFVKASKMQL